MKLKATITFTKEYEINRDHYPPDASLEEIIEIDRSGIDEDPFLFVDSVDATMIVSITKVETE